MKNYITTYFYQDCEDLGASYGNIFLPLSQRNLIYWMTVYTLFFSSVVNNKKSFNPFCSYALFTNVSNFPFRAELEALGVEIYDDLVLTTRNPNKWATVKFFFDVIDYIKANDKFLQSDAFIMLDTDVVSLNNATPLFNYLRLSDSPVAYAFGELSENESDFHGVNISDMGAIGFSAFGHEIFLKKLIGGEFFCFVKNQLQHLDFKLLNNSTYSVLTTEEQILTLFNAKKSWDFYSMGIRRVWTTLRVFNIPKDIYSYIFLHLPSEKEVGLVKLYNAIKGLDPSHVDHSDLRKIFESCMPLSSPCYFYSKKLFRRIFQRFHRYFNSV